MALVLWLRVKRNLGQQQLITIEQVRSRDVSRCHICAGSLETSLIGRLPPAGQRSWNFWSMLFCNQSARAESHAMSRTRALVRVARVCARHRNPRAPGNLTRARIPKCKNARARACIRTSTHTYIALHRVALHYITRPYLTLPHTTWHDMT